MVSTEFPVWQPKVSSGFLSGNLRFPVVSTRFPVWQPRISTRFPVWQPQVSSGFHWVSIQESGRLALFTAWIPQGNSGFLLVSYRFPWYGNLIFRAVRAIVFTIHTYRQNCKSYTHSQNRIFKKLIHSLKVFF